MSKLPVLAYGSLREGFSNRGVIAPYAVHSETVRVEDFAMFSVGAFPFILPTREGTGQSIVADLTYLDVTNYEAGLAALDKLEGYNGPGAANLYNRVVVQVQDAAGNTVDAYIYVAGETLYSYAKAGAAPYVEGGDWVDGINMALPTEDDEAADAPEETSETAAV